MIVAQNKKAILAVCFVVAIFSQVILNSPLSRWPMQDLLLNDLWLLKRFDIFADVVSANFFASFDFSEGYGMPLGSSLKSLGSIFDPAAWLSLFMHFDYAVAIRNSMISIVAAVFILRLISSIRPLTDTAFVYVLSLPFAPIFFQENFSISLYGYFLFVPALYYGSQFLRLGGFINFTMTFFWAFFSYLNTDLNSFFSTLIFLFFIILYFYPVSPIRFGLILMALLTAGFIAYIDFVFEVFLGSESIRNSVLENGSFFVLTKVIFEYLISIFSFSSGSPLTLSFFPIIGFFLILKINSREAKVFFGVFFLACMLSVSPFIFSKIGSNIPSYLRYHFTAVFIVLVICGGLLLSDSSENGGFSGVFSFKTFIVITALSGVVLFRSQSIVFGFAMAGCVVVSSLLILSISKWDFWKFSSILSLVFLASYFGFSGGFVPYYSRVADFEFRSSVVEFIECFGEKLEGNNSYVVAIAGPSGRHDLGLALIEKPPVLAGRTFFHWRHSYPAPSARSYAIVKDGYLRPHRVNFFAPTLLDILSVDGARFVDKAHVDNLIVISREGLADSLVANLKETYLPMGYCKIAEAPDLGLNAPAWEADQNNSFTDTAYVFNRRRDEGDQANIRFSRLHVEIDLQLLPGEQVELPFIFHRDLYVSNAESSVFLRESKDGFVVAKNNGSQVVSKLHLTSWAYWRAFKLSVFSFLLIFIATVKLRAIHV